MANRTFRRNQGSLIANPINLYVNFAVAGAGAVANPATTNIVTSTNSPYGPGVTSVVHTSTGVYTITLQDKYTLLVNADVNVYQGTATQAQFTNQICGVASWTQNTIVLNCVLSSAATTLADPASGIQISCFAVYDNTSMPY